MPPKRSDTLHITFHAFKTAILLSVPETTTLADLKSRLLPALQPLGSILPAVPSSPDDVRLYEDKDLIDGQDGPAGLRSLEGEDDMSSMGKTLLSLGWPRWKKLYISFRDDDGGFSDPVYTIPDVEDEEE